MASWILKAALQKSLSLLPFGRQLHHFLQRRVRKSVRISADFFEDRLERCHFHLQAYRSLAGGGFPERVLEIGTGWFPIVPIGMYLCGVDKIFSVDLYGLLRRHYFLETIDQFKEYIFKDKLTQFLPLAQRGQIKKFLTLIDQVSTAPQIDYARFGFYPQIADARNLVFQQKSFDLICSNNTFEHIPEKSIREILLENRRLLKNRGVISHYIDLVDHYSYSDKKLPAFNFLSFSKTRWGLIENPLQSQNRLRVNQHIDLFAEANLPIDITYREVYSSAELPSKGVHQDYADFDLIDLLTAYTQLISKPFKSG